jgi:hypothetical protein
MGLWGYVWVMGLCLGYGVMFGLCGYGVMGLCLGHGVYGYAQKS